MQRGLRPEAVLEVLKTAQRRAQAAGSAKCADTNGDQHFVRPVLPHYTG
jgi:hypothetical protein